MADSHPRPAVLLPQWTGLRITGRHAGLRFHFYVAHPCGTPVTSCTLNILSTSKII